MALEKQELAVGTRPVGRYKKEDYPCQVVATEVGQRYRLADGREFKSLSAAGSAIIGGAINGWRFWSLAQVTGQAGSAEEAGVEGAAEDSPSSEPSPQTEPTTPSAKAKIIKRTPNQKGAPEGQTRWFCSACMGGFLARAGETPETCPQGHRAETDGNGQVVTTEPPAEAEEALPF